MTKAYLLSLMLLFTQALGLSQSCNNSITGTIKDYHDGKPLELAQIYVNSLQKTFSTDENGMFKITGLCTGTYLLQVSHVECSPKEVKVEVTGNEKLTILLEHHVNELTTVNVLADIHNSKSTTQSVQRINNETLKNYSGATLGDALSSVAGVTSLKTGNSVVKPIVHGLYGSRVAIVTNGLRQQDQEWGVEHAPNIDPNTANNIEVVKGASALRYGGDAVGGTIIINPERVLVKDTLIGRIIGQGQSNGRGGSVSTTINNYHKTGWYQNATITYKRLGDYSSPDYVLSNTGSETKALNLRAGFKQFEYGIDAAYSFYDTEIGILRASHIGNVSDLVRSINARQPTIIRDFTYDISEPKQAVTHHALQLNAFKRLVNLGKLSFDYGFQFNNRLEFDIRRGENQGAASLDIDLFTHNVATHLLIDKWRDTTIESGIDGMYQVNKPDPATGVRRLIPDYNSLKVGAFLSGIHNITDQWIVDAGLRFDHYTIDADKFYLNTRWDSLGYDQLFPEFEVNVQGNQILTNPTLDYSLWAFTAGIKHIISLDSDLSFNVSTANRAPNPSELFSDGLHHALATIELGKLDLSKERSFKFNTTYHLKKSGLDLNINPYINWVSDFVQLEPTGVEFTTRGAFPVYEYRQINARLYGVDVNLKYDFYTANLDAGTLATTEPLVGLIADFAYIHGTDTDAQEPLIDMPPTQLQMQTVWYDVLLKRLDFRLSYEHVWEQNRFPDLDYEVELINNEGNREVRTVLISQPPDAFSLINVGLDYRFGQTKIRLSGSNIFNTKYRNYLNRQRFYADEVGRDVQLQIIYNL